MSLSIILIVVFAIIVLSSLAQSAKKSESTEQNGGAAVNRPEGDKVEKNRHVIAKNSLKLMSYEEALEASKKFIYDITRAVLQRFAPDSQQEVMKLGRSLFKVGMQYFHVVDIMSLSIAKSRTVNVAIEKNDGGVTR